MPAKPPRYVTSLGELAGVYERRPKWFRCKPVHTMDYVVMSADSNKLGPFVRLGLYNWRKELRHIMCCQWPMKLGWPEPGGVVECEGAEVQPSGALRHAQITRLRDDKPARDCVYNGKAPGELDGVRDVAKRYRSLERRLKKAVKVGCTPAEKAALLAERDAVIGHPQEETMDVEERAFARMAAAQGLSVQEWVRRACRSAAGLETRKVASG